MWSRFGDELKTFDVSAAWYHIWSLKLQIAELFDDDDDDSSTAAHQISSSAAAAADLLASWSDRRTELALAHRGCVVNDRDHQRSNTKQPSVGTSRCDEIGRNVLSDPQVYQLFRCQQKCRTMTPTATEQNAGDDLEHQQDSTEENKETSSSSSPGLANLFFSTSFVVEQTMIADGDRRSVECLCVVVNVVDPTKTKTSATKDDDDDDHDHVRDVNARPTTVVARYLLHVPVTKVASVFSHMSATPRDFSQLAEEARANFLRTGKAEYFPNVEEEGEASTAIPLVAVPSATTRARHEVLTSTSAANVVDDDETPTDIDEEGKRRAINMIRQRRELLDHSRATVLHAILQSVRVVFSTDRSSSSSSSSSSSTTTTTKTQKGVVTADFPPFIILHLADISNIAMSTTSLVLASILFDEAAFYYDRFLVGKAKLFYGYSLQIQQRRFATEASRSSASGVEKRRLGVTTYRVGMCIWADVQSLVRSKVEALKTDEDDDNKLHGAAVEGLQLIKEGVDMVRATTPTTTTRSSTMLMSVHSDNSNNNINNDDEAALVEVADALMEVGLALSSVARSDNERRILGDLVITEGVKLLNEGLLIMFRRVLRGGEEQEGTAAKDERRSNKLMYPCYICALRMSGVNRHNTRSGWGREVFLSEGARHSAFGYFSPNDFSGDMIRLLTWVVEMWERRLKKNEEALLRRRRRDEKNSCHRGEQQPTSSPSSSSSRQDDDGTYCNDDNDDEQLLLDDFSDMQGFTIADVKRDLASAYINVPK